MDKASRKPIFSQYMHGFFLVLCGIYLVWVAAACSMGEPTIRSVTPSSISTPDPTSVMREEQPSWIFLDDSFENSTQVEAGAEVYRLVCSACHGYAGQGLNSDALMKWNPEDRNCWKSKCHGEIHPPDGFQLPTYLPPVKGAFILSLYPTALDLYNYLKKTMPWHAPGTMRDEEYWQVTAFLLDLNGISVGQTVLDANTAANFELKK